MKTEELGDLVPDGYWPELITAMESWEKLPEPNIIYPEEDAATETLQEVYALEESERHREATQVIMRYIETNFSESNLSAVNIMLELADLNKLSKRSIGGLVRISARAKNHLPAWSGVYREAKVVLTRNGDDVERIMVGIRDI